MIFDNLVFDDPGTATIYSQKKSTNFENTDELLDLFVESFNLKKKSANDEASLNILISYNHFTNNQFYDALKYQLLNEKKLSKINNPKLYLANKLIGALIYEKQGAYNLACAELINLKGQSTVEDYQIESYLGYLKLKDENYNDAYNLFISTISNAKKTSAIDCYYSLVNLSKICDATNKNTDQLNYALKADSVINSGTNEMFNSNIDYNFDEKQGLATIEALRNKSLINLSVAYRKNGQYKEVLNLVNTFIDKEKRNKKTGMLTELYINRGLTYTLLKDYNNASSSYYEALKIEERASDETKKSEILNLLAKNSYLNFEYLKAVDLCQTSISISRKKPDYNNLAASYYILSETYARNSDYASSQKYFRLYNETKETIDKQKQGYLVTARTKSNDAKLLVKKAESDILENEKQELEIINTKMTAEQKNKEVLLLKKENELKEKDLLNHKLEKEQIERNLIFIKQQLEKEQLEKKYVELNREREIKSLESKNNKNEIELLNTQKKVYIRENQLKTTELNASRRQTQLLLGASFILLLFILSLVFLLFKLNKQKKTIELYNETIQKTNLELENNIQQVTSQKQIIEDKNEQIIDGINYSQRIQESLLVPEKKFRDFFSESFILFLPKEIVSGDFYLTRKRNDEIIVAVVDCTGHGVPGAMIAALAYQEIVHLVDTTSLNVGGILDALNERINFLLNSNNLIGSDGMDLMLISINEHEKKISYSGAKSSFLMIGKTEMTEFKTDKKSIGEEIEKGSFNFQTHSINYETGDLIYLYTDGYIDQFSELDRKRIGSKRFKSKIQQISSSNVSEQKKEMENFLNEHKKSMPQTDDITLITIKLNDK